VNAAQVSVQPKKGIFARGMNKAAKFLKFKDKDGERLETVFRRVEQKIDKRKLNREEILMLAYDLTVLVYAYRYPKEPDQEKLGVYKIIEKAVEGNEAITRDGILNSIIDAVHAGIMQAWKSEIYFSNQKNRADFIEGKVKHIIDL
jgi:hypothetical protein